MLRSTLTFAILASSVFLKTALACLNGTGFLPENDLHIPVSEKSSGLSFEQYNAIIDKVAKIYDPIAQRYGWNLVMNRKWESDVVNAGTYRERDNLRWHVNLYGGFARHPLITEDGYSLVICHEIGHHIGGAPKKLNESGASWASTEGQSDYFATLKCLRKIFAEEDNVKVVKAMQIPQIVKDDCEATFKTEWEAALCIRTAMAGLSVAAVNAHTRKVPLPEFEKTDPSVVGATVSSHPEPQCRLDTYVQGSICEVPSSQEVSQIDEVKATCHPSLRSQKGMRPLCWYKPNQEK